MAELLSAIEEDREPIHSANHNLRTLALTFAAVESAETGLPIRLSTPALPPSDPLTLPPKISPPIAPS
jgi:hypothetical protein